ncbi:AMP-binding protein [Acidovorax sp. YS12]|nr:AMP-binding protein [Acidovorax sp. YS12]
MAFQAPSPPLSSLADIERFEQAQPFEARCTATSIHAVLAQSAAQHASRTALTLLRDDDPLQVQGTLTYGQLFAGVTQTANLFTALGGPRVGVALMLPNLVETQLALWGAECTGYAVPLNVLLSVDYLVHLVQAADARILVAAGSQISPDLWAKAQAVAARVPGLKLLAVNRGDAPPLPAGALDFNLARAAHSASQLDAPSGSGNDRAAFYHTGGTTGAPKLVAHTHRNQITAAFGAATVLGLQPDDVLAHGLPLFHVAGTIFGSLAQFMAGTHVLMLSSAGLRNPQVIRQFWKIIERHRVTIGGGVPTSIAALLGVPVDADISSLRMNVSGAASIPRAVAQQYEAHTGRLIHQVLGMTECGGIIAIAPAGGQPVADSVGFRIPYTKAEIRRLAADGSVSGICAPNEVGVLVIQGNHVSPGYHNIGEDQTFMGQQTVNSGDLAYADEAGRIYIVGRSKDLIIRSGHNIDPGPLEDALLEHPAVAGAAAVGQPDRHAGELPVCYVVFKPGKSASEEELRAFMEPRLPERPSWPKHYYTVESLPMTGVGKPFKPALRMDAAQRLAARLIGEGIGAGGVAVRCEQDGKAGMRVVVELAGPQWAHRERIGALLEGHLFSVSIVAVTG